MKNAILITFAFVSFCFTTCRQASEAEEKRPNVVFVFADEWRAQELGYEGNQVVQTPNIDKLASQSIVIRNCISGVSVCCPWRASFLTGQYPLTNGVFLNDVLLNPEAQTIGKSFKAGGYDTGYIGKWHLDGHGRSNMIPLERRQGFDYWKVLECTHDYYNSYYWDNNDEKKKWDGYDAFAQTEDAISYIESKKDSDKPFFLVLSWGPPHTPFHPAPEEYLAVYADKEIPVRPNVPKHRYDSYQHDIKGYYSHISALDHCIGMLQKALQSTGLDENTIFVFTSDHGHMVFSHDENFKQKPYEESIHVPFVLRHPKRFGTQGRDTYMLMNTPDIMPTLLSLCGLPIPESVEGDDLSPIITGEKEDYTEAVLISCLHPFGQWNKNQGGREYRGVRTKQFTYVRDLNGAWLLFDNNKDPYQMNNLVHDEGHVEIMEKLEDQLQALLKKNHDSFLPGMEYVNQWGYVVDATGTVPYREVNYKGEPIMSN
ncbi:MAG: sulfatase [Cyclobacteriaceae bacterium]|nr:sulfatase [Cyclobacteriaceae bacterium]